MGCGGSKEKEQQKKPEEQPREEPQPQQEEVQQEEEPVQADEVPPVEEENKPKKYWMNGRKTVGKKQRKNRRKTIDWEELKKRLPFERTEEQREQRGELFAQFDLEANGYVNLLECRAGCRDVLKLQDFNEKIDAVIERAFNAAKSANDAVDAEEGDAEGMKTLEKCEFRLLMVYLFKYFEAWHAFQEIDNDNSGKVSIEEFKKAVPQLEEWGVKVEDPEEQFRQLDSDEGGTLEFDEFADWALRQQISCEPPEEY